MEGFRSDHTCLTFDEHISFSILKQKFIVMFLTLILDPALSACRTESEGGGGNALCMFLYGRARRALVVKISSGTF